MRGVLSKQELPAHISRGLGAQLTSEWQDMRAKLSKLDAPVYGTVAATVKVVTADAVTNDKTGISSYPATLTLDKRTMNIDGKQVAISPGMNVTVEIKTGQRRVIEYLLSPIQRAGSESLRER
jgi:hemolysin D